MFMLDMDAAECNPNQPALSQAPLAATRNKQSAQ